MNKLLTTIILLCFSVAANAEVFVCTDKIRTIMSEPMPGISTDYTVFSYDDDRGYIIDTDRGVRRINREEPFEGSCEVINYGFICTVDISGFAINSIRISAYDGTSAVKFAASQNDALRGSITASMGTCIKI